MEYSNVVVIWSLSKYQKDTCIYIFKKNLSLISFYIPTSWTIKIIKESSNNHILEAAVRKWFTKKLFLNFAKLAGKYLWRSLIFIQVARWKISQNLQENNCTGVLFEKMLQAEKFLKFHKKITVPESRFYQSCRLKAQHLHQIVDTFTFL